ncbi:MAG: hypothetical protein QNJ41_09050 [Xenococcaceae cyanobacterium MO_188.B32]|nr:hypothetical protein [Xenococcaceae cyanobacterium MO_188.B32]
MIEIDHFFVCTNINAPEIERVLNCGLIEGRSNIHPGQGTANRCIFFHNAMLEFLWVTDEQEVRTPLIAPTHLWEKWRYQETGYSPFGIGFRRITNSTTLPFATWAYCPPYLPPNFQIDIASNTDSKEPLLFIIPNGSRPDTQPRKLRQPIEHPNKMREITGIKITIPSNKPFSPAISAIQVLDLVTFKTGKEHLAEIEFARGIQKQTIDYRPVLPLQFRW